MIIRLKDIYKMAGMMIVSFCAVLVCAMFLNYYLDLIQVEDQLVTEMARTFFEALCSTSKVVSIVSGGCLLLTTVVLLCFYIGHYIDTHQKQLGILKALGYSRSAIAKHFGIFGLPILTGTTLGYAGAHALMPTLYEIQNKDGWLPDVPVSFHPGLCFLLTLAPALFFSLLAIGYSSLRLKVPALWLIREQPVKPCIPHAELSRRAKLHTNHSVPSKKETDLSFLQELEKSNVRQKKSLVFFITFSVFCFAAMTQMSSQMEELSSKMMGIMVLSIGLVLAVVTLFIATTSVIKANQKTITMMKVFGYSTKECSQAVLGGYRPWAYFGFALGTIYQYILLKLVLLLVFHDVPGVPEYQFDVPVMFLTLAAFVVLYEGIMTLYTKQMDRLTVKEIMME